MENPLIRHPTGRIAYRARAHLASEHPALGTLGSTSEQIAREKEQASQPPGQSPDSRDGTRCRLSPSISNDPPTSVHAMQGFLDHNSLCSSPSEDGSYQRLCGPTWTWTSWPQHCQQLLDTHTLRHSPFFPSGPHPPRGPLISPRQHSDPSAGLAMFQRTGARRIRSTVWALRLPILRLDPLVTRPTSRAPLGHGHGRGRDRDAGEASGFQPGSSASFGNPCHPHSQQTSTVESMSQHVPM
jgi:hypothetical protein